MDPASLQNLNDIITPPPVPWLPPAPGWYAAGFSVLLLLGWFTLKSYGVWKRNKYRREALTALNGLEKEMADSVQYEKSLPRLPQLVKRTAIAGYGRNEVASLAGSGWLAFLDKTGSTDAFTAGDGKLLTDCSSLPPAKLAAFSEEQVTGLLKAVHLWINKHQV